MITKVCAIALISVVLALILKEFGYKSKLLFSSLCLIVLISLGIEPLSAILFSIGGLADKANISEATNTAVRAMGLGYVFGFTADICTSLGESDIAAVVLVVGKLEIFILALPFFERIVALGIELLG